MSLSAKPLIAASLLAILFGCNAVDSGTTKQTQTNEERSPEKSLEPAYELATLVRLEKRRPIEALGLHNVYVLSKDITSGSEPQGEAAFARLKDLGIKTILSVDGKQPDVEMASKFGMKYVHVPIQYKGIKPLALLHITKTFRELKGPFYVHCFHGRHRGPAAAAVGRIVLDGISREKAIAEMRQWSGTSSKYEGLYDLIARGDFPSAQKSAKEFWGFDSKHKVQGIAGAMVQISRAHDALKSLAKNGWLADTDHPDIDATNEAGILAEAFESMMDLTEVQKSPTDLQEGVLASAKASRELRKLLTGSGPNAEELDFTALEQRMKTIKRHCSSCHRTYRNH